MTSSWISPQGGNWLTPANWSSGGVPSSGQSAAIGLSGNYLVSLEQSATLASLTLDAAGATVLLAPAFPLANVTLDLAGSLDLAAGTLMLAGGEMPVATALGGSAGATEITTYAALDLGAGLIGGGALDAAFAVITATGSEAFGPAQITLGDQAALLAGAGTLTLGPAAAVTLGGVGDVLGGNLVNAGTLVFTGATEINPYGAADFTNTGTIAVVSGTVAGNFADFVNQGEITVAGTLTLGAGSFTNQGEVVIAPGAALTLDLAIAPAPGALGVIDNAGGKVSVVIAGSGATLASSPAAAAIPPPACFLAGTRIATATGEIAVECLRPGQLVATASGGLAPVVWMGERRIDCRRHPRASEVEPVRILADAFAPGLPRRDLWLSPDHAIAILSEAAGAAPLLVPAKCLLNGATVVQERVATAWYFHVELPCHDIIRAEGLAVESYLDTGNRGDFANAGSVTTLYPDFVPKTWAHSCAPLVRQGAAVTRLRRRLLARAETLGWRPRVAADPHLRIGARVIRPAAQQGALLRFLVPAGTARLTLASRAGMALETTPARLDYRRLGVRLGGAVFDGRPIPLDGPAFGAGFYPLEGRDTARPWRWSDGAGELALPPLRHGAVLDLLVLDAIPGHRRSAA